MIRKFSVANTQSNQSGGSTNASDTATGSIASPTSQLESNAGEDGKKLYAQSLESTENSVVNGHTTSLKSAIDPLLYPIGSDEHDTSTDEGLSMSEEDDQLTPEDTELNKLISDLDIDHKLKSAAQKGDTGLVKELLCNGAQVIIDENGSTAIHVAAQNGFAEVIRLLLEHGTDVDIPDDAGYTALHKAAGSGHLDVLELLINEGCDIDTQDDMYGNTPLHEAAWHGFSKSVDLLLKNKSNAFITNRAGCTPLHLAAQNGHNQSGRTLLYGGCSPDVKNNYGDTPLHTAARYGHAGIARILISAKCSIGEKNKNGDTALHITSAFKRRKIAKLLVEAGISTLVRNKLDETAVDIARRKGNPEIIEIIHQSSEVTSPIYDHCHPMDKPEIYRPELNQDNNSRTRDSRTMGKEVKKKSHNSFVSWIRKKFTKKSTVPSKNKAGTNGQQIANNEDPALFNNQYIKKPGFAYYRDLAGNIRQGPCGFVPACHCEPGSLPALEDPRVSRKEANYAEIKESQQILCDKMAQLKMAAEKYNHPNTRTALADSRSGLKNNNRERQIHPMNNANDDHQLEINKQLAQVENDLQELRGDLHTWLKTQADDEVDVTVEDNPFAYAVGVSQTRFGDDFDHERMARYDVTEQFPPPPRLFRSRSDETLSHSEYSYHGRAFKSKEAAMEELKTLKHHEELRARRKRIRAGGDELMIPPYSHIEKSASRSSLRHSMKEKSNHKSQVDRQSSIKPHLWQSRENIRQDDQSAAANKRQRVVRAANEALRPVPMARQLDNLQISNNSSPNIECNIAKQTLTSDSRHHLSSPQGVQQVMSVTQTRGVSNIPPNNPTLANSQYTMAPASNALQSPRPPPTYRLISAALSTVQSQNNEFSNVKKPPVPAQRSHSTLASRRMPAGGNTTRANSTRHNEVTNRQTDGVSHAPAHAIPFNQYQSPHRSNLLYSESRTISSSQSHLSNLAQRQQPSIHRQYGSTTTAQLPSQESVISRPVLPSYEEVKGIRNINSPMAEKPANGSKQTPYHSDNQLYTKQATPGEQRNQQLNSKSVNSVKADPALAVQTAVGESCCASSNPDSGYGGQSYDFYASQPSPIQITRTDQASTESKEYDSWYSRRLQDAARKINTYSALRPLRTMTSDV